MPKNCYREIRRAIPDEIQIDQSYFFTITTAAGKCLQRSFSKNVNMFLELLVENRWVTSLTAEKAEAQYNRLIKNDDFISDMTDFDLHEDRVDELYL